jgi:transcription antitermination factor NusG
MATDNGVLTNPGLLKASATLALPDSLLRMPSAGQPEWFVLRTRSRHEKMVAAQLNGKYVECMLPLFTSLHRWRDRQQTVSVPLFPGYVFVHIAAQDRLQVLTVHGAVNLVGNGARPVPLRNDEVLWLQECVKGSLRMQTFPYLKVGSRVRVRYGPLAGVEGLLVSEKNQLRVVLSVDLIQSSVAVEVDAADVSPIN